MVVTITLNPAIDKVYHCPQLALTGVHRAERCETYAAGKGINLARGIRDLGGDAVALGFAGGHLGRMLRDLLDGEGIPHDLTPTQSEVRLNPTIREPSAGEDLHVIEPDQPVTQDELSSFLATFRRHLENADAVAFAGSCRPGIDAEFVKQIVEEASRAGVFSAVDSRGGPLRAATDAAPSLLKPNREELSQILQQELPTEESIVLGAKEVVKRGAGCVVVSLGPEGAVLATSEGTWRAHAPAVKAANTVGCGDAMLAGLIVSRLRGLSPEETLRHGVAAGTVNVSLDTPGHVPLSSFESLLERVEVKAMR